MGVVNSKCISIGVDEPTGAYGIIHISSLVVDIKWMFYFSFSVEDFQKQTVSRYLSGPMRFKGYKCLHQLTHFQEYNGWSYLSGHANKNRMSRKPLIKIIYFIGKIMTFSWDVRSNNEIIVFPFVFPRLADDLLNNVLLWERIGINLIV